MAKKKLTTRVSSGVNLPYTTPSAFPEDIAYESSSRSFDTLTSESQVRPPGPIQNEI